MRGCKEPYNALHLSGYGFNRFLSPVLINIGSFPDKNKGLLPVSTSQLITI